MSGDIVSTSHNWSKKGSYHVRVRVGEEENCKWQWSDTLRVDIAISKFDIKLEEFCDAFRGLGHCRFGTLAGAGYTTRRDLLDVRVVYG